MNAADRDALLTEVLNALVERCPRLRESCYWAGASAISLEELHHRGSFDLDFHTRRALVDVRPILAEIQQAFPGSFELISGPDEFGSGFKGVFRLGGLEGVTVEVLSNFEEVPPGQLVQSKVASKIRRVTLERFLDDKIQCVVERAEARDLVDIMAVLRSRPELQPGARRFVETQDALILAERLGGWSEAAIQADLAAYCDVDPCDALEARELLLSWLREQGGA